MRSVEVVTMEAGSADRALDLRCVPTSCLLTFHRIPRHDDLVDLVLKCLAIGGSWFATSGAEAGRLEDEIDAILEDCGSEAATTFHDGESMVETLEFLLCAVFPGQSHVRLCIVTDRPHAEIGGIRDMAGSMASRSSNPLLSGQTSR